ncbi:MAG: acyl transferase [Chitinophagaceae bacterium]|nr:acyl transferase [Chitinophagaceae bacterium]
MITQKDIEIFSIKENDFEKKAIEMMHFQYQNCNIYAQFIDALKINLSTINTIEKIPFLPISFFKTHTILHQDVEKENCVLFESSATTGMQVSKHFVAKPELYEMSMRKSFENRFGAIEENCFLGLLPAYLERKNSSLVFMVNDFIETSKYEQSGFYLYNFEELKNTLLELEKYKISSVLFGVSFALIDFAKAFSMPLKYCKIIETGGMKGRQEEWTKEKLHQFLSEAFEQKNIFSEYGMTELLTPSYSVEHKKFISPSWEKVLVRDEWDALTVFKKGKGALNIIDLANKYSCSFIATEDLGEVFVDGSFELLGRKDNADLRGCSILVG